MAYRCSIERFTGIGMTGIPRIPQAYGRDGNRCCATPAGCKINAEAETFYGRPCLDVGNPTAKIEYVPSGT